MQLQRFPLIILAFAIGGCSAPNDAEMEQERTTSADAAIRSLPVDDWCKAEADRDIEAKMKLFTTDAVLMPPGKSDVIGQQAIRAWHEKMWQGTKYQCSGTIDEVQKLRFLLRRATRWLGNVPIAGHIKASISVSLPRAA